MKQYIVTMQHDKGTHRVRVTASDSDTAKQIVCKTENAPLCAAINVSEESTSNSPENIAIHKGKAGLPLRFYDRALCTADELPELLKQGWNLDTSQFAMKPASGL